MKPMYTGEVNIGWLYPEYMSTYGDKGNIIVLERRFAWRGIKATVIPVTEHSDERAIRSLDLIVGGGAQDRQQRLVVRDMRDRKRDVLNELFENGVPGLFVCGSPQLLGRYYVTGDGERIEGLGFFAMETRHPGHDSPRLVGTLVFRLTHTALVTQKFAHDTVVGFENHGGRTYLDDPTQALGTVMSGSGNNGEDATEGAVANNWFATYSHGPLLAKNPHIADHLIRIVLKRKTGKDRAPAPLDDQAEWDAHHAIIRQVRG